MSGSKKSIRIGIVRLSSFGDVVVSASLLMDFYHALQQHYDEVCIEWFVDTRFAGLLEHHYAITTLHALPIKRLKSLRAIKELWCFLRALGGFDIVLDLQGLIKSALVGCALDSRRFVGFSFDSARERVASVFYSERVKIAYDSNILARNVAIYQQALRGSAFGLESGTSSPSCVNRLQVLLSLCGLKNSNSSLKILESQNGFDRQPQFLESTFETCEQKSQRADFGKNAARSLQQDTSLQLVCKKPMSKAQSGFGWDTKQALFLLDSSTQQVALDSSAYRVLFVLEASIPQKTYPIGQYAKLALLMQQASKQAITFCLIYHEHKDQALCLRAMLEASGLGVCVFPPLDFNALKYILSQMHCVIGGDTGLTHLAWALKSAQVITLLGNLQTSRGKNMRDTKLSRVLLGNPYVLSQSGSFEIASIPPESICRTWLDSRAM